MSYFHDFFTTNRSFGSPPLQLTPSDGVSNACTREAISIEDRKLEFSLIFFDSGGPFLKYDFSSPYPSFPPMTISTTVSPTNTGNIYSLQYITSNKNVTVKGKTVGNSLSFELDELQSVKNFVFYVSNENGVPPFTLTELIGGPTRIPVPIKQVRKRRHEIIGASKISFPLAQHQSE